MPRPFVILVGCLALLSAATTMDLPVAVAATHTVCASDCDFSDVQAAIDAAATGDTVTIAAGVYPAHLIVRGKTLTVQGAGAATTVLDGNQTGRVLVVEPDAVVTVQNLTVRNGRAVAGPSFAGTAGGGIAVATGGGLTIRASVITANAAEGRGGGIDNGGTLTISESEVSGNHAAGPGGGIANRRRLWIETSTISGNGAVQAGGGIYNADRLLVTRSSIIENTASVGGGLANDGSVDDAGISDLREVVVHQNVSQGDGGGVHNFRGGTLAVSQSQLTGNQAGGRGGGLYADSERSTTVTSGVTLTDSELSDNEAGGTGGGIYWASGARRLVRTVVWGNLPDDCAPVSVTCSAS